MGKIRNILLFMICTLFVGIGIFSGTEYTNVFILILILIAANMLINQTKDAATFSIFFLSIFLPFYAILRAFLQLKGIETLSLYVNYIRDFVIILCFIIILMKQSNNKIISVRNITNKKLMLGINLLLANYIIGFVISLANGYMTLAIKGVHLNIIPILLVYIISNSSYINEKVMEKFIKFSILIGLIVSIIGIFFYLVRPGIFGQLLLIFSQQDESNYLQALNYSRMVSTFLSPNVFGSYMAILLLLTIHEALNNKIRSFYAIVFIVVFSVCLILSFSRGAWAFAIGGIFLLLLLSRNKFSKKQIEFATLSLFAIIAVFLVMPFINRGLDEYLLARFKSIFDFSNESSYGRSNNWLQVLEAFSNNIFGLGLGIASINLSYYPELAQKLGVNVVDGYYVKIIAETGIIGLLLFSGFLILVIHSLIKLIKKSSNERSSTYVLITAILFGFLIQSFGSNTFDFVNISPFLWIFIGFAIKLNRL
ncbi:O-antigen ligase family protein [Paenibacillus albidus]|uniref:O-antigen ligase family protein n=1 Tax=Paenibacillus albidus TaxID=2041023 RepID=UPI001BE5D476|nr:O-antigen ligase family protein [Paenibacillus albidus]MBT2290571.1 O-antigen ligase family protein [Paenibacillus albidus]